MARVSLVSLFRRSIAAIGVFAFAIGICRPTAGAEGERIVVVTSDDSPPYRRVIEGFRTYLTEHGVHKTLSVHSLHADPAEAKRALSDARMRAAPLVTVGSSATLEALRLDGDSPVVACMLVNGRDLRNAHNATGVTLDFALETQFQWIKKFVPKGRTIGVLYNPAENRRQVDAAAKVAHSLGLRLVAREVETPQELPAALASLAREVDVLWGLTDHLVLSPETGEAILLFSLRNRIPFTGLSESWVKAGALYALDRDYVDIGAQCGEMAVRVMGGTAPSELPPARPRKLTYAVNLRAAEHMKLEIPEDLVDGADRVFR